MFCRTALTTPSGTPRRIEKTLADDVARRINGYNVANTCWDPKVKGVLLQVNSIYNGWRFEDVWLDR